VKEPRGRAALHGIVANKDRGSAIALASFTLLLSISALIFYYHRGAILLYGDAVAHINIARRIFDSRTPGLFQLGTVWLPLPHLLDAPCIVNPWLWRTGIGASIPSMVAYVAGTLGIFRLVRAQASTPAAWMAALIYGLNPNLLYIQSTAMTETLYLALFIWTVVFFSEFAVAAGIDPHRASRSLRNCAFTLCVAMLVRYDAWFLAAAVTVAGLGVAAGAARRSLGAGQKPGAENPLASSTPRWRTARFVVADVSKLTILAAMTAGMWLTYNYVAYGNSLEFANGPYSARTIQQRSRTPAMSTYPGEKSPRTAALYFLKLSRLNLGTGPAEFWLFATAVAALLCAVYFSRQFLPWILLWSPAVFYVISISWQSVPIYFPQWWPFSYYNVRYGLQLLPAVAVFVALAYEFLRHFVPARIAAMTIIALVAVSYASLWWAEPICLQEAKANGSARFEFDQRLAAKLEKLPPSATLMMDGSAHPGAIQAAGIPFRRVLRESNPPFWEKALNEPARAADYVVAIRGDDVDRAVRLFPEGLAEVVRVGTSPGPQAVIYRSLQQAGATIGETSSR
jgi:hypothetical protein